MKNNRTARIFLALVTVAAFITPATMKAGSGGVVYFNIVTAPASATNSACLQNVMSYVDKRGITGLIPTDITANPAALYSPHLLRGCEMIYSSTMKIWDGGVAPSGAFADQFGQRIAWTLDYTNSTPFLASDIYFVVWSSDPANSIRFAGNIATNGTTALTANPLLRFEKWNSDGTKTSYYNGETIVGVGFNRVMAQVRVGWTVSTENELALDLGYFRNQMPLTNYVAFYSQNGWGVTNWISSRPFLTACPSNSNGDKLVKLEAQRHLGLTYGIRRTEVLDKPYDWTVVGGRMADGGVVTNTLPMAFYQAYEEGLLAGRSATSVKSPVFKVSWGPE